MFRVVDNRRAEIGNLDVGRFRIVTDEQDVGRRDVALDWDGNPALLIETVEVSIMRFRDVPEDFALAEGEGDFQAWKQGHIAYFARNGGYDPDMELVCERFRLVEVLRHAK